jgi:hypothetical protein
MWTDDSGWNVSDITVVIAVGTTDEADDGQVFRVRAGNGIDQGQGTHCSPGTKSNARYNTSVSNFIFTRH